MSRATVEMIGPMGRKVVLEGEVDEHKRLGFTVVGEASVASDAATPTPIQPARTFRSRKAESADDDSGED